MYIDIHGRVIIISPYCNEDTSCSVTAVHVFIDFFLCVGCRVRGLVVSESDY